MQRHKVWFKLHATDSELVCSWKFQESYGIFSTVKSWPGNPACNLVRWRMFPFHGEFHF